MEKICENHKTEIKSKEAMEWIEMNGPEDKSDIDSSIGLACENSTEYTPGHHDKMLKNTSSNVLKGFPYETCEKPALRSWSEYKFVKIGLKRVKQPKNYFFEDLEHVTETLKKRRIDSHSKRRTAETSKFELSRISEIALSETNENLTEGEATKFAMDTNSVEPSFIIDTNTVEPNKLLMSGTVPDDKCWVKVKFPNGKMIRNVFQSSEPLSAVQLWATLNNPSGCINPVALVQTFPSRTFADNEMHMSLSSLSLTPSCTLMTRSLSFDAS